MDNNVKVIIRVRPVSEAERRQSDKEMVNVSSSTTIWVDSKPEAKMMTFDFVANTDITQHDLFEHAAKPIVLSCIQGYNGTIFAYGQTGSGKTHTIQGPCDFESDTNFEE